MHTTAELRQRWPHGTALFDEVRRLNGDGSIFLSFSAGKDSIVSWLVLREHFPHITPIYKYLIPGLEFVEESLAYYESFFGTRIIRVPHPSLYRMLRNFVFQPPGTHCRAIIGARLENFDHEGLLQAVAEDLGLDPVPFVAVGTRAADSPQRRMAFARSGPINQTRRSFYPVWDMSKAELVDLLRRSGVRLPAEYRVFGRSFDGIDFRFLHGIRQHWPADYARILEFFPLAELELKRHEYAQCHQQEALAAAGG